MGDVLALFARSVADGVVPSSARVQTLHRLRPPLKPASPLDWKSRAPAGGTPRALAANYDGGRSTS